jgi:phenylpyruvate tautomerase PptA (4-oxalocrotonate tautomerase family)
VPLINVRTSLASVDNAEALLKELSSALAQQTGKPESYVMTMLETAVPMTFGASSEPSVFVAIKSIGSLRPAAMTAALMKRPQAGAGMAAPLAESGFRARRCRS